jgi:hypothetical protein
MLSREKLAIYCENHMEHNNTLCGPVSRPVRLGYKALICGLRQDFYFCQTGAGLLMRAPSLTRGRVCRLELPLALASPVILGSRTLGTHGHILLFHIRDFPNLENQVPVFISPGIVWSSFIPRHWISFS